MPRPFPEGRIWSEFKAFLIKESALAPAFAVVIGAALNDVVKALVVDGPIMPVLAVATPGGDRRTAVLPIGPFRFGVGPVAGAVINVSIFGFVA